MYPLTDQEVADELARHALERRARGRWAKKTAALFDGVGLEAILIGVHSGSLLTLRWDEIAIAAKRAQLEMDEAACTRRTRIARARASKALEEWSTADQADLEAWAKTWKRYKRASAVESRLEAERQRIWEAREALWKEPAA